MAALPLPIAALAAASHVAPSLVAPFFRRMMLTPRRHVRPPPVLSLPIADQRIDLGDGLVAWRWGQGPVVLLVHGFEGNRAQFAAFVEALVERGFAAVALNPDSKAPKDAKVLSKPFHLRDLVNEVEKLLAA